MSALALRTFALFAAAAILICHLAAVHGLAGRPLHYDENEAMHASWLTAAGERMYRDFFEDHPPHLALLLHSVLPDGDLLQVDVEQWAIRSRQLTGAFGAIAVGAVMLFAWRMTRSPVAPVVVAATLLTSSQFWARAVADIRAEAPTLALFWVGVVLLTWSAAPSFPQAVRAGTGIGLMFFAAVWNPKWPLESLLMGMVYLHFVWTLRSRARWVVAAVVPALVIAAVAVLPLFTVTTPGDYVFFNFRLKSEVVTDFTANAWIVDFFRRVPVWASAAPQHRWSFIGAALIVAVLAMRMVKLANPRLGWIAIALCASALVEFRFVYPYPYLWAQYLVMVAMTAALVYAMLPAVLEGIVERLPHGPSLRGAMAVTLVLIGTVVTLLALRQKVLSAFRSSPPAWGAYWSAQRSLQHSLKPGETVWISPPRHPVAAFDASYYWYNFRESAPSAIRARTRHAAFLPQTAFGDLPPCTAAGSNVRYLELGDWMPYLEGVCGCAERSFNAGQLAPTDALGIFEVGTERRPTVRGAIWLQRTRALWSDMCRRQEVFLRGGQLNIDP